MLIFRQNRHLIPSFSYYRLFFFFQAEDGIRDDLVTGVQTCALPIYSGFYAIADGVLYAPTEGEKAGLSGWLRLGFADRRINPVDATIGGGLVYAAPRSEERRVGKECRSRWSPYH